MSVKSGGGDGDEDGDGNGDGGRGGEREERETWTDQLNSEKIGIPDPRKVN
jgi:hypothetical protein